MPFQKTYRVQNIMAVSAFVVLAACSTGPTVTPVTEPYLPLGDEQIHIRADMHYQSTSLVGITAWVCTADLSVCGAREVDRKVNKPDYIVPNKQEGTQDGLSFFPDSGPYAKSIGNVRAGVLLGALNHTPQEGMTVDVFFNDFAPSTTVMPPFLKLQAPAFDEKISRSTAASVRVEWEPSGKDFPIVWHRVSNYAAHGTRPCDALTWPKSEGETVDDAGFFDIPLDAFPTELPAEGCEVAIMVERRHIGTLGEGMSGYIHGNAVDGIKFLLMP